MPLSVPPFFDALTSPPLFSPQHWYKRPALCLEGAANAASPPQICVGTRIRAKEGDTFFDDYWGEGWSAVVVGSGTEGTPVPQASFSARCLHAPAKASKVGDVVFMASFNVRACAKVADAVGVHPAVYEGDTVVRGPDWQWDDQDGGAGKTGIALPDDSEGWIGVRWEGGSKNAYRYGSDRKADVVLLLGASLPASSKDLPVGSRVVLAKGYAGVGDARSGPLAPGDVGDLIESDGTDRPYNVCYSGSTVSS